MAHDLFPGAFVECIDDREAPQLQVGKVYRVQRIVTGDYPDHLGRRPGFGLILCGVQSIERRGFSGARFKPAGRRDPLAVFRRFLVPEERRVPA